MRRLPFLAVLLLACSMPVHAAGFALASPDVNARKPIAEKFVFNGFGCHGENVSPAVVWMSPPKDAKSFALTVHDPDAPTGGSGWWHWLVIDIPPGTVGLQQGAGDPAAKKLPAGARQMRTDFGTPGWGGPCPPVGDKPHRYVFTIYALKVDKLEVPDDANAALVGFMINANRIAQSSFTAHYGRKK
ncbi:MAG TPA: YbhB/YbcL family Raf kinase inhibitor-like protein [Rhodocyclaceae bacterium]|nr:YbhB/YbcL family Raf kinase inhibitor-like protein [Rhodocyclaceae bacterium]